MLPISFAHSAESKRFSVIWSIVDSLHFLDWGSSYEIDENDDLTEMMTKLMNQNSKYKLAATSMQDYINDKDEFVSTVSQGIMVGAFGLIGANEKILEKMKKTANLENDGFKDLEFTIAETNAAKKKAWETILLSAGWSLPIIMDSPKEDEVPTGKIPFKITDKERKLLINRIDEIFSNKLTNFRKFKEFTKQGKETNPKDSTYIISAVETIRDNLSVETYEEAKSLE